MYVLPTRSPANQPNQNGNECKLKTVEYTHALIEEIYKANKQTKKTLVRYNQCEA